MAACWHEHGEGLLDAVVAAIATERQRQLAAGAKAYNCNEPTREVALQLIESLAGGGGELNFDRQPYFHALCQRHGVKHGQMMRWLRSRGLPDDTPPPPPTAAEQVPEPVPEPSLTRGSASAAAIVAQATQLLREVGSDAFALLGAVLSPEEQSIALNAHAQARGGSLTSVAEQLPHDLREQLAPELPASPAHAEAETPTDAAAATDPVADAQARWKESDKDKWWAREIVEQ